MTVITNGNYFANLGLAPLLRRHRHDWEFQVLLTTGLRRQRGNRFLEALRLFHRWGWRYSAYKIATVVAPGIAGVFDGFPYVVSQTCAQLALPVQTVRNANASDVRRRIAAFSPDVLISFSCPYILKKPVLAIPRIGCLNVHSSLLPAYAGVCTYVHVLADGRTETGITVHEMTEQVDAGRILAQARQAIRPGCSVFSLFSDLCALAPALVENVVAAGVADASFAGEVQSPMLRHYCGEPTRDDISRLAANGHALLRRRDLQEFREAARRAARVTNIHEAPTKA